MTTSTHSYFHRAAAVPLLNDTLGGALDKAAERWPDQEAVVVRDQGARLTFAGLRREADRLAAGLIALGLKPGDRVGLWSPNRIEWVLTQYATAKAGLILVNINPGYRAGELEYALNKVECRALITANRFKTTHYIDILRELAPELNHCTPGALRAARLPHLTIAVHFADTDEPGYFRFSDVLALGGPVERARLDELSGLLQPDDPINIQFTSGTTGSPKAATLTHHGLLNNGYFCGQMLGIGAGERLGQPFPLYHVGGMVCGSILGVTLGATIIYLGESFDPVASLETIQAERCTPFLWRNYGVDRDSESSGVQAIRFKQPARWVLRRRSGAGRCRAPGDGRYEHARFHLHLWHDRTVRQQRAEHLRRLVRTACRNHWSRSAAHGSQDRRHRRADGPDRYSGRTLLSRFHGHARLLERRSADEGDD